MGKKILKFHFNSIRILFFVVLCHLWTFWIFFFLLHFLAIIKWQNIFITSNGTGKKNLSFYLFFCFPFHFYFSYSHSLYLMLWLYEPRKYKKFWMSTFCRWKNEKKRKWCTILFCLMVKKYGIKNIQLNLLLLLSSS